MQSEIFIIDLCRKTKSIQLIGHGHFEAGFFAKTEE